MLLRQLQAHPDLTLAEHAAVWRDAQGVVSISTIARRIRALGWARKKDDSSR
ncbi:hypothetical protein K7W42_22735 [Deinococcus sp. HMF7604]|uniref:hypothetical protein n=1 Tax=Deinococcus betulae TaxID=2873312 RepID=UPI001CCF8FE3|nr:hypothetical protein [Deinococcus betulae]MBZ9753642.1 hypothetical protein [Deinococcus betulae]